MINHLHMHFVVHIFRVSCDSLKRSPCNSVACLFSVINARMVFLHYITYTYEPVIYGLLKIAAKTLYQLSLRLRGLASARPIARRTSCRKTALIFMFMTCTKPWHNDDGRQHCRQKFPFASSQYFVITVKRITIHWVQQQVIRNVTGYWCVWYWGRLQFIKPNESICNLDGGLQAYTHWPIHI